MIRTTLIDPSGGMRVTFPQMALAHKWCSGKGIECGAAAHNPFGLDGSLNLAPKDDFEFYKANQVQVNGSFAEVDIWGEAHEIPVPDASQDYIISSHVFEHLPDPIAALKEWWRVVKPNGIVFMIIPKRDALDADRGRDVDRLDQFVIAHDAKWTVDSVPKPREIDAGGRRGHYWVFSLQSALELVDAVSSLGYPYEVVETEETDSKVGNGHTLVLRRLPKPEEVKPDIELEKPKPTRAPRKKS